MQPPAFDAARAAWAYEGTLMEALQAFKYRQHWRIGAWLAREMAQTARLQLPIDAIDAVVSVPAHWIKIGWRGAYPAQALAARVSADLGIPYVRQGLRALRLTRSQTRLSHAARRRNVSGSVRAQSGQVAGRTLLLIDDVVTSGSTAEACAQALKTAGAGRVFVLCAARTPRNP
jgi:predicted amidophosphoribosyltransferase